MNRKNYIPFYLGIAVAFGVLIGSFLNFEKKAVSLFGANSKEAKVKRLIDYIQYDYVDKVDTDSLLDGAIQEMLLKLDPHSVYIPKENLQEITENMQGKFVGIGIQFLMHKDTLTILEIIDGGPSQKAGLKAGDRILLADKDTLYGKNLDSDVIIKHLKGDPQSQVNLTIFRKNTNQMLQIPVTRGDVAIKSVPSFFMINNSTGYIKIERFARTTYDEFKVALNNLLKQNMQSLVLDLRDNLGGYIDIAERIVDEFLEDKKLIVFTKNNRGKVDNTYATSKGDFENGELYVLINENSASASEIVAGALQDNDKGTIIGRRSFGKGLVQQEMELGDGSAVRLTTSRYYTPTGRSIQKEYGLDKSLYFNEQYKRLATGELTNVDSIKVIDSLKFKTPKGKVVYGGGGIIPDVFVSIDTTKYVRNISSRTLNDFAFHYVDNHRDSLQKIPLKTFVNSYNGTAFLNKYQAYLKHRKSQIPNDVQSVANNISAIHPETNNKLLQLYLKALVADKIYNDNGYYKVMQQQDHMIEKVLELIKSKKSDYNQ